MTRDEAVAEALKEAGQDFHLTDVIALDEELAARGYQIVPLVDAGNLEPVSHEAKFSPSTNDAGEVRGWQPIETANRDNVHRWLWSKSDGVEQGYFDGATWLSTDDYILFPTHWQHYHVPAAPGQPQAIKGYDGRPLPETVRTLIVAMNDILSEHAGADLVSLTIGRIDMDTIAQAAAAYDAYDQPQGETMPMTWNEYIQKNMPELQQPDTIPVPADVWKQAKELSAALGRAHYRFKWMEESGITHPCLSNAFRDIEEALAAAKSVGVGS